MQKIILATGLAFALSSIQAQDKTTRAAVSIPYEKFQLSNGLTVLFHEDHSDPIVYVDVTYHVGSAREQEGRSGFAHFFEHMMFQGSKHVADDQHFKIITEAGGNMNGTTNTDRTNYFETAPSGQFEKMLWLEADRMGFLLDSVTQRKFEIQRATVKNERGQRYDNAPYGLVGEKIGEALYPQGHPYSWTTIGYIVDLDRVDVSDLKRFYMRWYGPNNAVLTIAGDVTLPEVKRLAEKYFGSIQRGPEVKLQEVAPVKLAETRYISYEDNVKFPSLTIAYPTVRMKERDDAALDVLAGILSDGQGSPLYKAFIESGKAVSADCYQFSRELAGQFMFSIRANAGAALGNVQTELKKALDEWEKKGATDDDLLKYKAQYQSGLYNGLSSVQGKGARLAYYHTLMGNAGYLGKEIERYMSVTKEDVMRVYTTYVKNKPAVVLSCLPKGKGDLRVQADNWKMYTRKIETESAEYKNLSFNEPKDNFDRKNMPEVIRKTDFIYPKYLKMNLAGDPQVKTAVYTDTEFPKVSILINFRKGHRFEPIGKSGLAVLTAAMLGKSTLQTKAEEVENKLDRLGSSVHVSAGDEDFAVTAQCLKENLKPTLAILKEILFEPKFDDAEFEVEKKKLTDRIGQAQTSAPSIADVVYRKVIFGDEHIMGAPTIGNLETVSKLSSKDVKDYYASLTGNLLSVVVIGDISTREAELEMNFVTEKFKHIPTIDSPEFPTPVVEKTKIYFVDKKGAAQSEVRVGTMSVPFIAIPMYYKCVILNFPFAGAFNSRVNYSLREIKGWTYGVRGGFSGSRFVGPYTISGGFKANTTDSTIKEIMTELKNYKTNGITKEELKFTRASLAQSEALKYETPNQKLYFFKRFLDYDLSADYMYQQQQIIEEATLEDLNKIVKFRFNEEKMTIVIVGDKASNFEKVKKLGYEVIELDINGKPVNSAK